MSERRPGRLVIVDGVGADVHRWSAALAEHSPENVASLAEAADLGADDLVIIDLPQLTEETLVAIREAFAGGPDVPRLLAAAHDELPAVLRAQVHLLFRHVVPRAGRAENVKALVAKVRSSSPASDENESAASWSSVIALLQWTAARAIAVPNIIIRSYRPEDEKLEIQIVFRLDRAFERFHCELPRRWRWPARATADDVFTKVDRTDPSIQELGAIAPAQEIYVCPMAESATRAYVAILPWTKDDRITVAFGLWIGDDEDDHDRAERIAMMADLHAQIVANVPVLTLPTLDDPVDGTRFLLEYKWVLAPGYAGPDRRDRDTSMVNRYMFNGRRKTLGTGVHAVGGGFVDGIPRWIGGRFAVYAALAAVDSFCTSRFVSKGRVTELNPLLAPLIVHHPWSFLLLKNVLALAAFAIIVRFHTFRGGRVVLGIALGLYALLDAYWAVLLLR